MISLLVLMVLLAGAGAAVVATLRHRSSVTTAPVSPARSASASGPDSTARSASASGSVAALEPSAAPEPPRAASATTADAWLPPGQAATLAAWVGAGLITAEQSAAITRYERTRTEHATLASPARRMPAVAEALGYLGGALAVGGLVVLLGRTWPDLSTAGRLGLSGSAAALLPAGGWLLRGVGRRVLRRLRVVLWLAGCAASAVFAATAVHDGWGVHRGETVILAATAVVAAESGLLWKLRQGPALQLACLVAGTVVLGALAGHLDHPAGWVGLTVLAAGVAALALGLRRQVSSPVLTEGYGSFAALVGGSITAGHWPSPGLPLLVVVGAALTGLALVPGRAPGAADQVTVGVIGAVTLVQAVPATLGYFAPHAAAATGLVTYAVAAATAYLGARRLVRLGVLVEAAGGAMLLVGAAVTFDQWHGFAPVLGVLTAMVLIGLGVLPGHLVLSALGSAGLLVNVPWAISWFFPGRGRGPVLIVVGGLLIVAVAVLLGRLADRSQRSTGAPDSPVRRHSPVRRSADGYPPMAGPHLREQNPPAPTGGRDSEAPPVRMR